MAPSSKLKPAYFVFLHAVLLLLAVLLLIAVSRLQSEPVAEPEPIVKPAPIAKAEPQPDPDWMLMRQETRDLNLKYNEALALLPLLPDSSRAKHIAFFEKQSEKAQVSYFDTSQAVLEMRSEIATWFKDSQPLEQYTFKVGVSRSPLSEAPLPDTIEITGAGKQRIIQSRGTKGRVQLVFDIPADESTGVMVRLRVENAEYEKGGNAVIFGVRDERGYSKSLTSALSSYDLGEPIGIYAVCVNGRIGGYYHAERCMWHGPSTTHMEKPFRYFINISGSAEIVVEEVRVIEINDQSE